MGRVDQVSGLTDRAICPTHDGLPAGAIQGVYTSARGRRDIVTSLSIMRFIAGASNIKSSQAAATRSSSNSATARSRSTRPAPSRAWTTCATFGP